MLDTIIDLRRVGMSLSKIKEYLDNRTPTNLLKLYGSELNKIKQEIVHLKLMEKNLELNNNEVKQVLNFKDEFIVKEEEEESLILSQELKAPSDLSYFKMLGKTLSQYRQLSECSIVGTRLFKDDILRQDYNNFLNCYVKTMIREEGIFIKVKGKYLIFYHQGLIDKIGKSY